MPLTARPVALDRTTTKSMAGIRRKPRGATANARALVHRDDAALCGYQRRHGEARGREVGDGGLMRGEPVSLAKEQRHSLGANALDFVSERYERLYVLSDEELHKVQRTTEKLS